MASRRSEINSIEIARLAGVSRSTVSRVINNYPNVPPETREKVMRVIEKYNYFPNMSAQVLAGKKTRTIGLFLVGAGSVAGDIVANMLIFRRHRERVGLRLLCPDAYTPQHLRQRRGQTREGTGSS